VAPVTVEIVAVESANASGAEPRYVVRNDGEATVWVVDDGWLVWRREDGRIELGFQRAPMRPGVEPFGYFDPRVARLEPGAELTRTVSLSWPQPLDRMWNEAHEVALPPGEYEVAVRIGYGESEKPPPTQRVGEGVEAPVLAWQHQAVSEPVTLTVPG
jgi:hypothetical protein